MKARAFSQAAAEAGKRLSPSGFRLRFLAVSIAIGTANLAAVWLQPRAELTAIIRPDAGLAMAAILLWGRGMTLAVLLGGLCANLIATHLLCGPAAIVAVVVMSGVSALGALLGAEWLRHFCGGIGMLRQGATFFRFVIVCTLGLPVIVSIFQVLSLLPGGYLALSAVAPTWVTWSLSVYLGNLVFLPLVLVWYRPNFARFRGWAGLEGIVVFAILFFVAQLYSSSPEMLSRYPRSLLIVPLVLWIGFRFRGLGVTAAVVMISVMSIFDVIHGRFALAGDVRAEALTHAQLFIGIVSMVGLGFVAVLKERDDNLEKLRQLNEELGWKVAARTRELERINQELTDAISIVAHDVRGPVSGIRTLARHMRWAGLDLSAAEGNELLGEIERTSAEAVEMMGRLLDLQHTNHRAVGLVQVDVGRLVEDMCRHYEIAAQEKGIALRVMRPGREMAHLVDADGIKFIISNLVSNALKFLQSGGMVEVRVSEGFYGCMLVVSDNGPGISERELAGLFNRFAKAANRPTAGESSSGLGLFIVRKLVLAMSGTLYVESVPGEGAAFIVEWPAEAIRMESQPSPA